MGLGNEKKYYFFLHSSLAFQLHTCLYLTNPFGGYDDRLALERQKNDYYASQTT